MKLLDSITDFEKGHPKDRTVAPDPDSVQLIEAEHLLRVLVRHASSIITPWKSPVPTLSHSPPARLVRLAAAGL